MEDKFKKEEEYILAESQELSIGENTGKLKKIFSIFPAFESRNYRLYFFGQLISLTGSWLQIVALGWLVYTLTNSAFFVGLVAATSSVPTLILSLFGGVLVDRYSKRKIFFITQITYMLLAFTLGFLTILGFINIYEIFLISFLTGVTSAIEAPTRQSFAVEMVGKKLLPSAIALNAGIFNAARVIGPSFAGFSIALIGTGGTFILNGLSFVAVIIALFYIKPQRVSTPENLKIIKAIKEGIIYSFSHPIIKILLIFIGVASIFGWSYSTILPVVAKTIFGLGPSGLGYLYSSAGLGAVIATILISALGMKVNPNYFIFGGCFTYGISIILFSLTSNFYLALLFLFFTGFGILSLFNMMNSTIQYLVEDRLRGRVMSIYSLMFFGFLPFGNIQIGFIAEKFGSAIAIRTGGIIMILFGLAAFPLLKEKLGKK